MSTHARGRTAALLGALLVLFSARLMAHPMPNTEIAITLGAASVAFDIAIPEPELRLALPPAWGRSADLLVEPQRSELTRYFDAHFSVLTPAGATVPYVVESITHGEAQNPDVGKYQELRIRIAVPETAGFDPRRFSLHYDAVIHQVPNHFALVFLDRDFHTGRIADDKPVEVGVIRYDFRHDSTPPFDVTLASGSAWRGLLAAVALGFRHVSSGIDHLLFLASLLIVSPLRAIERRWSLFQGWRYTARRFLRISLAFTAGHSLSLLLGAFAWVQLPHTAVEIAIALSVLLAAFHAIRPLFAGNEWKIAAGFGLVHGLAFSETLSGGGLDSMTRAAIVLGFNLGVEGAQLVAMACAVPLLYASRWRGFHGLRIVAMACVVVLAVVWIAQRAS
ncbi:MAG: HupE/UreJ family protein [Pseudomonadota bacterium]